MPNTRSRPQQRRQVAQPASVPPETVDPGWLLKALAAVLALGLVCAYVAVCALFAWGQWQLVLHPSRTVARRPSELGLDAQQAHFGVDGSGQPQLTGWWIPATASGNDHSAPAVLLLHGGDGSLADALPRAATLHSLGLGVLIFDYRGFGQSLGQHPTEALMRNDAESGLRYLTTTRGLQRTQIIPYGIGLGASLATELCAEYPDLPALVTESADGDTLSRVRRDPRARIVPVGWLFHERFPLADPLHHLRTPKLLLSWQTPAAAELSRLPTVEAERAADPKMTAEIPAGDDAAFQATMRRFLDSYVPHPPATLMPR
jgi:uncharacterized protein